MNCIYCKQEVYENHLFCTGCGKNVPASEMEQIISDIFRKGYIYQDILNVLYAIYGITISLSTLKRKLKSYGLQRRNEPTPENFAEIAESLERKLHGTGNQFGYRTMWHSLRLEGITIPRDVVMYCLKEIDPEGVSLRRRHKLKRRLYRSLGPNFCWHMDGYDKLKPFGFPIHGCIDGFSRKLLWLELVSSNNNPYIIANLYLKAVRTSNLVPRKIRADHGTENTVVASAQTFLSDFKDNAFMYESSHTNQRIESWWSFLRKNRTTFLINFFRELVDGGLYDPGDDIQKALVWFCFSDLIKEELNQCMEHWNSHYIRKSEHSHVHGRPAYLIIKV